MSHYCVAVISKKFVGDNVHELLEPYDENKRTEFVDCTEEVIKSWTSGKSEYDSEIDKSEYNNDINIFADEYYGYSVVSKGDDKKFGYWHNPKAKWDWYTIGGRWEGLLTVNDKGIAEEEYFVGDDGICTTNVAKIKNIDFSINKEKYETSLRFWELYIEDDKPKNEEEEELKNSSIYRKEFFLERYKNKETYAKAISSFSTFAVLTDEDWFEKGSMGWFGCSDESHEEALNWSDNFYETFIKNADPEAYITIVDCHI